MPQMRAYMVSTVGKNPPDVPEMSLAILEHKTGENKKNQTKAKEVKWQRKRKEKKEQEPKKKITHHGRAGHPVIHISESGKKYIMVRKKGGGVKRLYEGSKHKTKNGKKEVLRL